MPVFPGFFEIIRVFEITIKTILAKGGDIPPPLPRPEIGHRDNKDPSNYLN